MSESEKQLSLEDFDLTPEVAEAVILVGQRPDVGAYDGQVPEDDGAKVDVAKQILDVCLEYWYRDYRGPDVRALLEAAGARPGDDGALAYDGVPDEYVADDPDREPADPDPAPGDVAEAAAEAKAGNPQERDPEPQSDGMQEPWDGYDGLTVAKIKEFLASEDVDADGWEYLLRYEKAHSARKGLVGFYEEQLGDTIGDDRHDALDEAAVAAADADPDPEPEPRRAVKGTDTSGSGVGRPIPDDEHEPEPLDRAEQSLDEEHHLPGVGERKQRYARSQLAQAKAEKQRLPIPPEPHHTEDPVLPADLDDLSHEQVNQLYLDFTACLTRATWLYGLAKIDHRHAKRIHSHEAALAFRRALDERDENEKPLPEWKAKAVADADPEVHGWAETVEECRDDVDLYETMRDTYQAAVDALSRVEGFRHEEYKRSR